MFFEPFDLGFDRYVEPRRFTPFLLGRNFQMALGRLDPIVRIERGLENRAKTIVIALRNRVIFMVMTTRAADRQPKHRRAQHLNLIGDHRHTLGQRAVRRAVGPVRRHA